MLLAECAAGGVERWQPCAVDGGAPSAPAGFELDTGRGPVEARSLVVATGGLSIPKIGASDLGYALARQFGHRIVETRPALVPLVCRRATGSASPRSRASRCRCAIAPAAAARRAEFAEDLLFTHRGLSGPGGAADLDLLAAGRERSTSISRPASTWRARPARRQGGRRPQRRHRPRRARCRAGWPRPGSRRRPAWPTGRWPTCATATWPSSPTSLQRWRIAAGRHRGLQQGRGHGRRRRHPRARFAQRRKPARARPALHRRGGRRHRLAGRLQLPVGLGQRGRLRPGAGRRFADRASAGL